MDATSSGREEDSVTGATLVEPHEEEQLMCRRAELRKQLESRNEALKELMDTTRGMLEAMTLWEAHRTKVMQTQQAAAR